MRFYKPFHCITSFVTYSATPSFYGCALSNYTSIWPLETINDRRGSFLEHFISTFNGHWTDPSIAITRSWNNDLLKWLNATYDIEELYALAQLLYFTVKTFIHVQFKLILDGWSTIFLSTTFWIFE